MEGPLIMEKTLWPRKQGFKSTSQTRWASSGDLLDGTETAGWGVEGGGRLCPISGLSHGSRGARRHAGRHAHWHPLLSGLSTGTVQPDGLRASGSGWHRPQGRFACSSAPRALAGRPVCVVGKSARRWAGRRAHRPLVDWMFAASVLEPDAVAPRAHVADWRGTKSSRPAAPSSRDTSGQAAGRDPRGGPGGQDS